MKILYVCSEFYAGMMPFGASVVNAMQESEHEIYAIFVSTPRCDYKKTVHVQNPANYIFIESPKGKFSRLFFRVFARPVINAIKKMCKEHGIQTIHLLTEDSALAFYVKSELGDKKLFYTVHDLKEHETSQKNFLKRLVRVWLVEKRVRMLVKNIDNLVTCSKVQVAALKKMFPSKKVYYHSFPSLITDSILKGNTTVRELKNIGPYYLFFGRIDLYKGVHVLYDQYLRSTVKNQYPLVIAGSGDLYFDRQPEEENVIFINRYIEDDEIVSLYSNAFCVVYPYISATQSGVISLAHYFKKPVIVSDIPYFKVTIPSEGAYFFDIENPNSLRELLNQPNSLVFNKENTFANENLPSQVSNIYKG